MQRTKPQQRAGWSLCAFVLVCVAIASEAAIALDVERLRQNGWGVMVTYLGSSQVNTNVTSYQSQVHQDAIIDMLFKSQENGFFIDLASNDAVRISNTVYLEAVRHWKGICVEVNPAYEAGLLSRKCTYVKAVVGADTGSKVQFTFQGGCGPACGGVVSATTDNKPNPAKHVFTYETVKVGKILDDLQAPRVIEYMSLDIEGMEYVTFKDFDFEKYKFKVLTVERPKALTEVLKEKGYLYIGGMGGFGETLWVNKNFISSLNLAALKSYPYVKLVPDFDTLIKV